VAGALKKILVLSIWEDLWSIGEGGGAADELHFIRYLTEHGIELHFLIPEPAEPQKLPDLERLHYHTYPNLFRAMERRPRIYQRIFRPLLFPRIVTKTLRRLAREIEPDILLGFTYYPCCPLRTVGRELGIPTAVKLFGVMYLGRDDLSWFKYVNANLEPILYMRCAVDHYIVLNDGTMGRDALIKRGIPPEKISFLPNGMDTEWADLPVSREQARERLGLPAQDVLVFTFSRLVASKRIELFIDAAALIDPELRRQVTFVVAGDGPERHALEQRSHRHGLAERTIFTGMLTQDEVPLLLRACDIFVGTNELTNMSLPPCEAIMCGVPVVAFDVAGTAEVVRDGETGLLVSRGDIEGMAKRIETLIRDGELRSRLGRNAYEFGKSYFMSWDERLAAELDVLKGLCHR
jgi:glycosyltransferase involved in cell wall biosynthesis